MILRQIFRRDRIKRFFKVAREEGLRAALYKVRMFLGLLRAGHAPSMVAPAETAPAETFYLAPFWLEAAEQNAFHVRTPPVHLGARRKIAMIGDLNLPQCRKYRVEQPAEIWALAGVDYEYAHYQDIPRCILILQDATHVMFYRLQSGPLTSMYAYEARRLRLQILYDLDDPLFSVSAYGTYENMKALPAELKTHFLSEAPKYLDAMMMADIVSVSTPGLRTHTELYLPSPVHCRRNFADAVTLERGQASLQGKTDPDTGFRVAFASGSHGHEIDFAVIQGDLAAFLAADRRRRLVILGHFDANLLPEELRDQVEAHPFTNYDDYLGNLASADCAVMPLTDDVFNRCKSAVRVIDAAAVAVPALVSGVSDMAAMVEEGVSGHVMTSGAGWRDALEALAKDRRAARAMGQAARRALETDWSARTGAPVMDPEILSWARA